MLATGGPIPLLILMFTRQDLTSYLLISPLIYFFIGSIVGGAVTGLQDMVLPRMYGTIGAIFLVGQTLIGISLGPYVSGKIATVTGSLQIGMISILASSVLGLVILLYVGRHTAYVESNKLKWAAEAGEGEV